MMSNKHIYSLNLIAFIQYRTGIKPQLHMEDGGLFYATYPEGGEVGQAILDYRDSDCEVKLHDFLNVYKTIRDEINSLRH